MTMPQREQGVVDSGLFLESIQRQQGAWTHVVHGVAAAEAADVADCVGAAVVISAQAAANKFHGVC